MSERSQCARCPGIFCYPNIPADQNPSFDEAPPSCPTRLKGDIIEKSLSRYNDEDIREFARLASVQEFECYEHTPDGIRTRIPRIEETIQFAWKNGFKRLGIAFCSGLANEARLVADILERKGFEVVSVCCKVGAVPKERIGIKPEEKISGPDLYESMCNPITQAEILNEEEVDFAILIGLCVGHDSLFIKYCQVPMTVLAVKDRVTGHNPLAAVYLSRSPYYRRLRRRAQA
ncbi:MAG TPA: DUF1847 domain-containing protein [Dehalococcoidia bacterium]|nr:DUF1847 domain-containing protein [Dehalococcoidia bacterium]